jgi:hypothetical protein
MLGIKEICSLNNIIPMEKRSKAVISSPNNIIPMEKKSKAEFCKGGDITILICLTIIAYMVLPGFLLPDNYVMWAVTAGWFAAGLMCLWNFKSCGRYHCAITGPGFFGLGILSLVEALGIFNPAEWIEWSILCAVLAIGFGLEYVHKIREGSCYCKIQ